MALVRAGDPCAPSPPATRHGFGRTATALGISNASWRSAAGLCAPGSYEGGEWAAAIHTLIRVVLLDSMRFGAGLRDVLTRIADGCWVIRIGDPRSVESH